MRTFGSVEGDRRPQRRRAARAHHGGMPDVKPNSSEAVVAAQPIRVLVAESDPHLGTLLCWIFNQDNRFVLAGHVVTGDQAVACDAPFDLALVDLRISGLGGLGTIARLHHRVPVPAVVVLADNDPIYLRHAAADEGAIGFLVIPDDLDHLTNRIVELVQTASMANLAPAS
jgi:DNA-binding response OmpR family regulator